MLTVVVDAHQPEHSSESLLHALQAAGEADAPPLGSAVSRDGS